MKQAVHKSFYFIAGFSVLFMGSLVIPSLFAQDTAPAPEWVEVTYGSRTVHSYLALPGTEEKSLVVIVIHENQGLNAWAQSVAERLAQEGYIAIAPDLLSGMAPNGGKTGDFPSVDAARNALNALPPDQITGDLNAVADYAKQLEQGNGQITVAGFCWGGGEAFRFATNRSDLSATFVFYGSPVEDSAAIARINGPIYGFYGGSDSRITSTVPQTQTRMNTAGKTYEPVTYSGAGHAFMRSGEDANATAANRDAKDQSWTRWLGILEALNTPARVLEAMEIH